MTTTADIAAATGVMPDSLRVSELHTMRLPAWIGAAVLSLTCAAMWLAFRGTADPRWLADLWMAIVVIQHVVLVLLLWQFVEASPTDREVVARWVRRWQIMRLTLAFMIAAAPWALMPEAPAAAQMLGIALIPWYLAISVLVTSTSYPIPAAELGLVAVSGAAFAVVQGLPYAWLWALFLLAAFGSMVALREQARRSVVEAVARGLAVEAAAAETRQALAVAAAERDAKARFIASASHDLRQPLAAARIWARIGLDAPPGPARADALAKADAAFGAATGLVDSMLDHLRLEAGAEMARVEAVPVGPVLLAAAEAHAPTADAAGLRIRAMPSALVVAADPGLLARAIDNLVVNAIRHSGGRRLLLGARRASGGVAIWAIDDGRGIAADERNRLFDDYAQGALSGPGGFGIGLASVRRQLALMAGEARIDPRWTGGAAFRLWLPAARPARAACAA